MSENTTPGASGQAIDPTAAPIHALADILKLLRDLSTRMTVLEERFEYLDRDVLKAIDAESIAVTDADPESHRAPSLAFTSDGRVLLSVTYLAGIDLTAREQWTGVVLTEAEASDVRDAVAEGCDDAAAHVGGYLIAQSKKRRGDGGE